LSPLIRVDSQCRTVDRTLNRIALSHLDPQGNPAAAAFRVGSSQRLSGKSIRRPLRVRSVRGRWSMPRQPSAARRRLWPERDEYGLKRWVTRPMAEAGPGA
jgi:hypothetical protein